MKLAFPVFGPGHLLKQILKLRDGLWFPGWMHRTTNQSEFIDNWI